MSTDPNLSVSPRALRPAHSPRSPHLPYLEEPQQDEVDEQTHPEDVPDEDDIPYPEPSSEHMLLPPPNFKPFFTLIDDKTSGEQYHPYVHYVFADDDPIIVTAASMRGLGLDDTKYLPPEALQHEEQPPYEAGDGDAQEPILESPLPPPIPGVRDHYLIIDVGADGRTIVDAQSLSSEWQITSTDIRTAPSFDESSPDQGYMLRLEGVEVTGKGKGKGQAGLDKLGIAREQSQGDIFGALDNLVQSIEEGLEVAGKISSTRPRASAHGLPTDSLQGQEG